MGYSACARSYVIKHTCMVMATACTSIIIIITSTSDLQPSTPHANQLPGQLVSTEIRTMYKYKF